MKKTRKILPFIIALILFACSQENQKKDSEQAASEVYASKADTLVVDQDYVARIESLKTSANQKESDFINELMNTITKFSRRPADTVILELANLDGIDPIDTVYNRIFVEKDTVYLESSWSRMNEMLWQAEIINPYLWISDRVEFDYGTRSTWVTFTIALNHSLPKFYNLNEFPQISRETATSMGSVSLNDIQFDAGGLPGYIDNFKGQLLEYGEPELREGLFIWHEPSKHFISYYRP